MKVLVLAPKSRYDAYTPNTPASRAAELVFADRTGAEAEWLAAGADAEALFVTPVTWITESLMEQMPNLKMIHSEGVGFDRIDLEAARRRGVYVCNNAGCNAPAVAELAVTLMSMLLHRTLLGDWMVKNGRQEEMVKSLEVDIPPDLSVSTVGLVGFGAIAQATARLLGAYGSKVYYYARHRKPQEVERAYGVEYLPLSDLAQQCGIVSLHVPANPETARLIGRDFFARMRPGGFLVNTARGAVVDDAALCEAIRSGHLAGAALDAYDPEPVTAEHPLVALAAEFPDRLILSPHQGGVSRSAFRAAHEMLFSDLQKIMDGERPDHVVNGL